jgi:cyclophilin family peptidyl-prolyl cis-trans isomerase
MAQSVERPTFQQAGIRIVKPEEFEQLHSALMRIFAPAAVEKFLRLLQRKGVPIRDFHRVLREKLLDKSDATLASSGRSAQEQYNALTVSDQAQMREFYLTTLEAVDQPLRERFNKIYRYY